MVECKSFAFLTLHKAGSAFAADIIGKLFSENCWRTHDFATEAFRLGVNELTFIQQHLPFIAKTSAFFGPFRGESVALIAEQSNVIPIIHIRDPRDCLVSNYYSICFSHVLPGPGPERATFLEMRASSRNLSIDEFCLDILTNGNRSFQLLRYIAESRPDAIISRYEDMVSNFPNWITALSVHLPIRVDEDKISELDPYAGVTAAENIHSHKRQITPGDFRRKLSSKTQAALTEFFHDDLIYFGYPVGA